MTDAQLFSEISALPANMKQEVINFVASLKSKNKKNNSIAIAEEPTVKYGIKFSDLLLNGPVFSDTQIQKIEETRKSLNEWRTK
ncbi:hypothetical protein [Pedobacter suwonensis]|uniref:hypothetical protein n=1 Tax=Pedobacter suwonensis TaxID=332999 RepID=UPI0011A3E4AB|nr:hypothetical protein [Pedobacter suwonensis]